MCSKCGTAIRKYNKIYKPAKADFVRAVDLAQLEFDTTADNMARICEKMPDQVKAAQRYAATVDPAYEKYLQTWARLEEAFYKLVGPVWDEYDAVFHAEHPRDSHTKQCTWPEKFDTSPTKAQQARNEWKSNQ
jgi:hypothetical protein